MPNYLKQILHTQFFSLLNIIFGFVTLFILIKYMPKEQYGEYVLIQGFISIGSLIFSQNIYSYTRLQIPGIKKDLQYSYLKTVLYIVMGGYFFSIIIIELLQYNTQIWKFFEISNDYAFYVLLILGFNLINMEILRFMIAIKKIEIKNYVQFFQKIFIMFAVLIQLIFSSISLQDILYIYLLGQIFIFFILIYKLDISVFLNANFTKDVISKGYKTALPLLPIGLMSIALNYTDTLMIAKFVNKDAVASYGFASQIVYIAMMLIGSSVVLTLFPYATEAHNKNNKKERANIFLKMFKYGIVLSLLFYLLILLGAKYFINLIHLKQYLDVPSYLYIMALFPLFQVLYNIGSHYLQLMKIFKLQVYVAIFVMLENAILNYFFILYNGVIGAAYASLISFMTLAIIYNFISFRYGKKRLK